MKNGRCRMHGGRSTGPRTPEGKERCRLANLKHGRYTREAIETRRYFRAHARMLRMLGDEIKRDVERLKRRHPVAPVNPVVERMIAGMSAMLRSGICPPGIGRGPEHTSAK
jgi:hypothetical protein